MYDKCYFCLDQLPKLKKESTASFFVNFGRSRGTKEPTYITVYDLYHLKAVRLMIVVMPYPSNPCEDYWAKRGQAISCHLNFNFLY